MEDKQDKIMKNRESSSAAAPTELSEEVLEKISGGGTTGSILNTDRPTRPVVRLFPY